MRDFLDAVVPICAEDSRGSVEHIGSGVLIDFRNHTFLLSAGHILDRDDESGLLIPSGSNVICGIDGAYSYFKPAIARSKDMMDFGYIKLDPSYAEEVKKLFTPITEAELIRTDDLSKYELFSFSGYPHRKSRSWEGKIKTEMYSYSAYLATPEDYIKYGCNIKHHLLAKFDRKNTIDAYTGSRDMPPLPHGLSGGGVFAWPDKFSEIPPPDRRLIAICHTYKEKDKCFIATNVNVFLNSILYNNPGLR